jgi:uncharacterized phage-associated protein
MNKTVAKAQYLVNIASEYGPVTPMKIQKLLYYVKAWGLVAGHNLVPDDFEKWDYGPVNRKVYNHFRKYGGNPISAVSIKEFPFSSEKKSLVDFIATSYAQFDAITLSSMTHKESPWNETAKNSVISEGLMFRYYSEQPFAQNFPFDPKNKPFVPVKADSDHGFTLDMTESDANNIGVYESYEQFLESLKQASKEYEKNWKAEFLA